MIARHIHHALDQVRELQQRILEKQRFRGYSGRMRLISGGLAILTALVLSLPSYPKTVYFHLLGWALLFTAAIVLNYGALVYWFVKNSEVQRDLRRLGPALEALPILFVGGILSYAMVLHGFHHALFGIWMTLFGLMNLASRQVLPRMTAWVGVFYLTSGAVCLVNPSLSFLNPWPMGVVFFIGEFLGGLVFHFNANRISDLWDQEEE